MMESVNGGTLRQLLTTLVNGKGGTLVENWWNSDAERYGKVVNDGSKFRIESVSTICAPPPPLVPPSVRTCQNPVF